VASWNIAGIDLPFDLEWADEFDYSPIQAGQQHSVTGALIYSRSQRQAGRPITLRGGEDCGWISRGDFIQVQALADDITQGPHVLTHPDGRQFSVHFKHDSGPAVTAEPVLFMSPQIDSDRYIPVFRFIEV